MNLIKPHNAGVLLSFLAFLAFVANLIAELAGHHFELTGLLGSILLGGFLACGLLVQTWKWWEGSQSRLDAIVTFVSLSAHFFAEIIIWTRTRVFNESLPVQLPMIIVGTYWITGFTEIFFKGLPHQLKLFAGTYKSPETMLREEVEAFNSRISEMQNDRALLEQSYQQQMSELEKQRALLEQSLTSALTQQQQISAELEKRDRQLERINERAQKADEQRNQKHELGCSLCDWTTGKKDSEKSAEYALRAHMGRNHANGKSKPVTEEYQTEPGFK